MSIRLIDMVIMALIPLSIGAALLFAAFGGRLPAGARKGVQFALAAVAYPGFTLFFGWQALTAYGEGEWSRTLLYAAAAVIMAGGGVKLVMRRLARDGREAAS